MHDLTQVKKPPSRTGNPPKQTNGGKASVHGIPNRSLAESMTGLSSRRVNLDKQMQQRLEQRFGAPMPGLKVFKDKGLGELNARAFAKGNEIHIAEEEFDLNSQSGRQILFHEAGHVVQQGAGLARGSGVLHDGKLEHQADTAFSAPESFVMPATASGPVQGLFGHSKRKAKRAKKKQIKNLINNYKTDKAEAAKLGGENGISADISKDLSSSLFEIQSLLKDEEKNKKYDKTRKFIMNEFFDTDTGENSLLQDEKKKDEFENFWSKQMVHLGQTNTGKSLMSQIYERRYGKDAKKMTLSDPANLMNYPGEGPSQRENGKSDAVYDPETGKMKRGVGSDSKVTMPNMEVSKFMYENTDNPFKFESLVSVFHEMTHGLHSLTGTRLAGDKLGNFDDDYHRPANDLVGDRPVLEEYSTTGFGKDSTDDNIKYFTNMFVGEDSSDDEKKKIDEIFSVNEQNLRKEFEIPEGDSYNERHYDPNGETPGKINAEDYAKYKKYSSLKNMGLGINAKKFQTFINGDKTEQKYDDNLSMINEDREMYQSLDKKGKKQLKKTNRDTRTGVAKSSFKSYFKNLSKKKKVNRDNMAM